MRSLLISYKYSLTAFLMTAFIGLSSCKKYVEVPAPFTSLNGGNVFTTDATAIAAVTAMYTNLGYADGNMASRLQSITYFGGLSADELTLMTGVSGAVLSVYKNDLSSSSTPDEWGLLYKQPVYLANAAIEGLTASNSLTPAVK